MYKNLLLIFIVAIIIISFFVVGGFLVRKVGRQKTESFKKDIIKMTIEFTELGYMEGQIDAINGDIRIMKAVEEDYEWTKSPWDGGRQPAFQKYSLYKTKD